MKDYEAYLSEKERLRVSLTTKLARLIQNCGLVTRLRITRRDRVQDASEGGAIGASLEP